MTTGYCHRRQGLLSDAQIRVGLLAPHKIKTGILVADACSVLPVNSHGNTATSLGARLIAAPKIGAVAFNCEVYPGDIYRSWQLSASLEEGVALGAAIADFNKGNQQRISRRMMYVGDPDLAFAVQSCNPTVKTHSYGALPSTPDPTPLFADLAFMRRCIAFRSPTKRHFKALQEFETATLLGLSLIHI